MTRAKLTWLVFGSCVGVVAAVMLWGSHSLLELERAQRDAQRAASLEEAVRLVLWRMDSAMGPILSAEANRPFPSQRSSREVLPVVAPFALQPSEYVRFYFEVDAEGNLLASAPGADAQGRIAGLRDAIRGGSLSRRLIPPSLVVPLPRESDPSLAMPSNPQAKGKGDYAVQVESQQIRKNIDEYTQRWRQSNLELSGQQLANQVSNVAKAASVDALVGVMSPIVVADRLLLARRISKGGVETIQGCELDWEALSAHLVSRVPEVLPEAKLTLVHATTRRDPSRMLASIPATIIPGELPASLLAPDVPWSTTRITLAAAWIALAIASLAVAILLAGAMRLSERRAAFVSAVTHELRTPLTTFQLYTQMLAQGRVTDEEQRLSYLNTLHSEAQRLTHLVENVLAHARLERRRTNTMREPIAIAPILDRTTDRLRHRAEQSGMILELEMPGTVLDVCVAADPVSVEQILMNLVDNACKYAATAEDRRVHLRGSLEDGCVALCVCDHGPGITPPRARRLFRAFEKSASEAAATAPGIGLGLALSRRLARAMRGDLRHDKSHRHGASMTLLLPLADV